MPSVLVRCNGFVGDALYASSLAPKLNEMGYDRVVYLSGIPQVKGMLSRNPHINEVITTIAPMSNTAGVPIHEVFDREIHIPACTFVDQPTIQMQIDAGVGLPTPDFTVYTDPTIDELVVKHYKDSPYVTVMEPSSWEAKSYLFTREEYVAGIDVPPKGYGGKNRNIKQLLKDAFKDHPELSVIYVGVDAGHPTMSLPFARGHRSMDLEASLIKHSVAFLGAEGGLSNIAGGVNTRTILTYDFVHQLYGWNGVIRKISPEPKLGPRWYFDNRQYKLHVDINPYLSDEEAAYYMSEVLFNRVDGVEKGKIFVGMHDNRRWL